MRRKSKESFGGFQGFTSQKLDRRIVLPPIARGEDPIPGVTAPHTPESELAVAQARIRALEIELGKANSRATIAEAAAVNFRKNLDEANRRLRASASEGSEQSPTSNYRTLFLDQTALDKIPNEDRSTIVKGMRAVLARVYHHDKPGSGEKMKAVNSAIDSLTRPPKRR